MTDDIRTLSALAPLALCVVLWSLLVGVSALPTLHDIPHSSGRYTPSSP